MTKLGPYAIESVIARGATSVVYRARDTRDGQQVALKTLTLDRELAGDALAEARARFLREAQAARRLRHPDIATLRDAGEAQGVAYLAMALLPGHDLSRHVAPGRLLPAPQVLRIVARVADALAYAHAQGVVHRDIKAANVIVDLGADRVAVTDFGIARIADARHTRTGMLLGTPQCMAPEVLVGQRADGPSDLYSLGVLLFQLLCGRLPFDADALGALMRQVVNDPAPDLRDARPDLPAALAALVARLLAKDPALRPPGGDVLARELRANAAALDAAPASAGSAPPGSAGNAPDAAAPGGA